MPTNRPPPEPLQEFTPCPACGQSEYEKGKCLPCKREIRDILLARVAELPPCARCGDQDFSLHGDCRPCGAADRKRLRDAERTPEMLERKKAALALLSSILARIDDELAKR